MKNKKFLSFLIFFNLFLVFEVKAAQIDGKIYNSFSRIGVPNLIIEVEYIGKDHPSFRQRTKTDRDGFFIIRGLSPGQNEVSVLFSEKKLYNRIIDLDEKETINIKLNPKTAENSIGMKFVFVPPGQYLVGSPIDESGRDDDEMLVSGQIDKEFFIQETEVTQEQWENIMGENPSQYAICGLNCPVESVTIPAIKSFIDRLNKIENTNGYRLPTELEWEYACRAGTHTPFNSGECLTNKMNGAVRLFANFNARRPYSNCVKPERYPSSLLPVRTYPANEWGVYDMHGNIGELCLYRKRLNDPPFSSSFVVRGGSFWHGPKNCRSAVRLWSETLGAILNSSGSYQVGFRLIFDPTILSD
jgi:formylglycine-generating enzyme required for sulfatase activity